MMKVDLGPVMEAHLADRKAQEKAFENEIRDHFAIGALHGMLQSAPLCDRTAINKKKWAEVAYDWADAMLEVRKKRLKRK